MTHRLLSHFALLLFAAAFSYGSSVVKTVGASGADYATIGAALTDINTNGLADTVTLSLIDTVYNEGPLLYGSGLSQPKSLYIAQGGAAKPRVNIAWGGLLNGFTVNNRDEFVLYNVRVFPDTSDPNANWNSGVRIHSPKQHSWVYVQSGGVVGGNKVARGYDVTADSTATVQIFGCLLINVAAEAIHIELNSYGPAANPVAHWKTGRRFGPASAGSNGRLQLDGNQITGSQTAMKVSGGGYYCSMNDNEIYLCADAMVFDSSAHFADSILIMDNSVAVTGKTVKKTTTTVSGGSSPNSFPTEMIMMRTYSHGGTGVKWECSPWDSYNIRMIQDTLEGTSSGISIGLVGPGGEDTSSAGSVDISQCAIIGILATIAIPNFVAMDIAPVHPDRPAPLTELRLTSNMIDAPDVDDAEAAVRIEQVAGATMTIDSNTISMGDSAVAIYVYKLDKCMRDLGLRGGVIAQPRAGAAGVPSMPEFTLSVSHNTITGGSGIVVEQPAQGSLFNLASTFEGNTITFKNRGLDIVLSNDTTGWMSSEYMRFGSLIVSNSTVTPSGAIPNFVCMQLRSKRSELPANLSALHVDDNTFNADGVSGPGTSFAIDDSSMSIDTLDISNSQFSGAMTSKYYEVDYGNYLSNFHSYRASYVRNRFRDEVHIDNTTASSEVTANVFGSTGDLPASTTFTSPDTGLAIIAGNYFSQGEAGANISTDDLRLLLDSNYVSGTPSALAGNKYEVSTRRGARFNAASPRTERRSFGIHSSEATNRYELQFRRSSRFNAAAPKTAPRGVNGAMPVGYYVGCRGHNSTYGWGMSITVDADSAYGTTGVYVGGNHIVNGHGNGLEVNSSSPNVQFAFETNQIESNSGDGLLIKRDTAVREVNYKYALFIEIRGAAPSIVPGIVPITGSGMNTQSINAVLSPSVAEANMNSFSFNGRDGLHLEGLFSVEGLNYQNLYSNTRYNLFNGTPGGISATYNWWGTTSGPAIASKIFDHADSSSLGAVDYTPFRQSSVISTAGNIQGTVYLDTNGDSSLTGGETGLSGWQVQLKQGSTPIDTAVTDANGLYGFPERPLGTYTVKVLTQNGYIQTENHGGKSVHFASGNTETVNFGEYLDQAKFRTYRAGTNLSGKPVKIKFDKHRVMTSAAPNIVTAMENTFARLGKNGATFLGVSQSSKDSAKVYAWIAYKKAAELGKFYTSAQTGETYPIDSLRPVGKKAAKLKGAIKADRKKHNNVFWEQAVMFRLNLIASQLGVTPVGFGGLELDTNFTLNGKQLRGMSLAEIAIYADSLATYWKRNGVTSQAAYDNLGDLAVNVYQRINEAFAAEMDTSNYAIDTASVTTGDPHTANKKNAFAVTLRGVKTTSEVGIVNYVPGAAAVNAIRVPELWDGDDQTVEDVELPTEFALNQNYPNPFNPATMVSFDLPTQSVVTLKIYNMLGQEVAVLADRVELEQGRYAMPFDASQFASGVYFYRISGTATGEDGVTAQIGGVRKMLLVR